MTGFLMIVGILLSAGAAMWFVFDVLIMRVQQFLHAREHPEDTAIMKRVLKDIETNPECFEVVSNVGLKIISRTDKQRRPLGGHRVDLTSWGSATVAGRHMNTSMMTERRMKRDVKQLWKKQKRTDRVKSEILKNTKGLLNHT